MNTANLLSRNVGTLFGYSLNPFDRFGVRTDTTMNRSFPLMISCLSLSVACASASKSSANPDAGQYDGYYDENGNGGSAVNGSGDPTATPGARPQPRSSTSSRTRSSPKGKSIKLVSLKPPVPEGEKPEDPRDDVGADFGVAGFFPTAASVGSLVEIYGSGFPEDAAKVNAYVGGKPLKIVEVRPDRIVAEVLTPHTGVVEVGRGKKRTGRVKTKVRLMSTTADAAFGQPRTRLGHGLLGAVYQLPEGVSEVPDFNSLGAPMALIGVDDLDIPAAEAPAGVAGLTQNFGIHFQGSLNLIEAGEYELCLSAGDGALLFLDQTPIIDNDGTGATREVCESIFVEPGEYGLDLLYYQGVESEAGLTLTWAKDGGAKQSIPPEALFPPEDLAGIAIGNEQAAGG